MEEIKNVENLEPEVNPALDEQFETKEIPFEDYEPAENKKTKRKADTTLGFASLVFGILAIIGNFVTLPMSAYFPFVGIFCAIGDKIKNKKLSSFGFSGLVCSIVAYALSVVATIISLIVLVLIYVAMIVIIAVSEGLI